MPWIKERELIEYQARSEGKSVEAFIDDWTRLLQNEDVREMLTEALRSDQLVYVRKSKDGKLEPYEPEWVEGVMIGIAVLIGLSALICAGADLMRLLG